MAKRSREDLTRVVAAGGAMPGPRCAQGTGGERVGEVVEAIRVGVGRSVKDAEVIVWDWGWPEPMARNLIPKLARDMEFMSVSEWSEPIERGGIPI